MCVKAGPPLQSPSAQTPGTVVSRRPFTLMEPSLLVAMPALARPRSSVLGTRPAATRRCEPVTVDDPAGPSYERTTEPFLFSACVVRAFKTNCKRSEEHTSEL